MIGRAARAIEARVAHSPVGKALGKVFPDHWSFLLGEIAMYSLMVLVGTGLFLALHFEAGGERLAYDGPYAPLAGVETSAAFRSVMDLSFEVRAGLLLRQTHHWAALVFTAAITLHACRIFFTGAFRRPRRLNWAVGVTLLGLALANGFFGMSMTDDLLSGTGLRVAYSFALGIPVIGPGVAFAIFGGEFPADNMIHRLWFLHAIVIPLLIGALFTFHMVLVWRQTHTHPRGGDRREDNVTGDAMWPAYMLKTLGLASLVAAVLLGLGAFVQINPVWQYGPFSPADVTVPAQPDWYLGWVEGALRVIPSLEVHPFGRVIPSHFWAGFMLPVLVFLLLYTWPLIEERLTGDRGDHHLLDNPRDRPVRTAFGAGAIALLATLHFAGSHDFQGLLIGVPVDAMTWAYRILVLAVPLPVALLTYRICRDLAAREGDAPGEEEDEEDEENEDGGVGATAAAVADGRAAMAGAGFLTVAAAAVAALVRGRRRRRIEVPPVAGHPPVVVRVGRRRDEHKQ